MIIVLDCTRLHFILFHRKSKIVFKNILSLMAQNVFVGYGFTQYIIPAYLHNRNKRFCYNYIYRCDRPPVSFTNKAGKCSAIIVPILLAGLRGFQQAAKHVYLDHAGSA